MRSGGRTLRSAVLGLTAGLALPLLGLAACGGDGASEGGANGAPTTSPTPSGTVPVPTPTATGSGPVASCTDGVRNGTETDVDCGGGCSAKCALGKACLGSADCGSTACVQKRCVTGVAQIMAGDRFSCARSSLGEARCWGWNFGGQLGVGDRTNRTAPQKSVDFGPGRTAVALSTGASYVDMSCAIVDDKSLRCWGSNYSGQLGIGNVSSLNDPPRAVVDLGAGRSATAVAVGSNHVCAILDDGTVECWGDRTSGGLGDGTAGTDIRYVPGAPVNLGVGRTARALSAGFAFTCAILDDKSVKCWGRNDVGQLGLGDAAERFVPSDTTPLGAGRTATAIASSLTHTCAILDDKSVKCWGDNRTGQLGLGAEVAGANAPTAVDLGPGRTALGISCGFNHTCAVTDDGGISCWGRNDMGQLGIGTVSTREAATRADLGAGVVARSVSVGGYHTCAALADHTVKCWGWNGDGQLGTGNLVDVHAPGPAVALGF